MTRVVRKNLHSIFSYQNGFLVLGRSEYPLCTSSFNHSVAKGAQSLHWNSKAEGFLFKTTEISRRLRNPRVSSCVEDRPVVFGQTQLRFSVHDGRFNREDPTPLHAKGARGPDVRNLRHAQFPSLSAQPKRESPSVQSLAWQDMGRLFSPEAPDESAFQFRVL